MLRDLWIYCDVDDHASDILCESTGKLVPCFGDNNMRRLPIWVLEACVLFFLQFFCRRVQISSDPWRMNHARTVSSDRVSRTSSQLLSCHQKIISGELKTNSTPFAGCLKHSNRHRSMRAKRSRPGIHRTASLNRSLKKIANWQWLQEKDGKTKICDTEPVP